VRRDRAGYRVGRVSVVRDGIVRALALLRSERPRPDTSRTSGRDHPDIRGDCTRSSRSCGLVASWCSAPGRATLSPHRSAQPADRRAPVRVRHADLLGRPAGLPLAPASRQSTRRVAAASTRSRSSSTTGWCAPGSSRSSGGSAASTACSLPPCSTPRRPTHADSAVRLFPSQRVVISPRARRVPVGGSPSSERWCVVSAPNVCGVPRTYPGVRAVLRIGTRRPRPRPGRPNRSIGSVRSDRVGEAAGAVGTEPSGRRIGEEISSAAKLTSGTLDQQRRLRRTALPLPPDGFVRCPGPRRRRLRTQERCARSTSGRGVHLGSNGRSPGRRRPIGRHRVRRSPQRHRRMWSSCP